jgi:hypothetical protein
MNKVIDVLKSNKHYKNMQSFIAPVYPADYDSVCMKRMDLAMVRQNINEMTCVRAPPPPVRSRPPHPACRYNCYKEFVEDIRLIFLNGLKYNARYKEINAISRAICDAAEVMQGVSEGLVDTLRFNACDYRGIKRVEGRNSARMKMDVKNAKKLEEENRQK